MQPDLCPACEIGNLVPVRGPVTFHWRGVDHQVQVRYAMCDTCGESVVPMRYQKSNDAAYAAIKAKNP